MTSNTIKFIDAFTVIFLLDQLENPTRIGYLKRASWKKIAPNWLTGIGGTIEEGETAHANALREMQEEIGLTNLPLTEFAQAILSQEKKSLHYYYGIYPHKTLPTCNEGDYAWSPIEQIPESIIGTTYHVLREWQTHQWSPQSPFTIIIKTLDTTNGDISLTNRIPAKTHDRLLIPATHRYFDAPSIQIP